MHGGASRTERHPCPEPHRTIVCGGTVQVIGNAFELNGRPWKKAMFNVVEER